MLLVLLTLQRRVDRDPFCAPSAPSTRAGGAEGPVWITEWRGTRARSCLELAQLVQAVKPSLQLNVAEALEAAAAPRSVSGQTLVERRRTHLGMSDLASSAVSGHRFFS